jgi:hypothetical protein
MSHCTGAPAEQCLERYIQGTLPDAEAQQFVEHYFDCPVCLAQVEALQAVRTRLSQLPASQQPASQPPAKKRAVILSWQTAGSALVGLAASWLVVFLGYHFLLPDLVRHNVTIQTGPHSPATPHPPANSPSSSLAQLADLTLPPFRATTLRGGTEDASFAAGMKAYSAGDCHTTVTALNRIPPSATNALTAEFYSAVCQMHLGNLPAASAALQRVAAVGESPQQEAAFYYLAQIAFARNDAPSARQNLDRTVALHGDFEQRARRQSAALAAGAGKH